MQAVAIHTAHRARLGYSLLPFGQENRLPEEPVLLGFPMLVVGLTGGIGSGKTEVANRFAALGITVVDADVAARAVVEPGQPALAEIAAHFGPEVIQEDGSLDRGRLRQMVFTSSADRIWLEALLHPLIHAYIGHHLKAEEADSPYAILVSPLLIETGQADLVDRILVIDAPEETQIERVIRRDNDTRERVRSIQSAQASRAQRLERADDTINNAGDLEQLDAQVVNLHQRYLQIASARR